MSQAQGSQERLVICSETVFKTALNTNGPQVLPFVSESLRLNRNLIDSRTIRANRNPQKPVRGNRDIAGDITVELDPYLGKMFYHALGTFTFSGASPYSQTYVVGNLPVGLSVEKQFLDIATPEYFTYTGCKINSMKMSFNSEGFIETVFNLMGALQTVTTAGVPFTAITNWSTSDVGQQFDGFEATIKEGGQTLATCTKLDLTLENNLDGSVYVIDGTGSRYAMPVGLVKVSGTVSALFEDVTLYNKAINNAESSLQITLIHGTGTGAANNEKLDIFIDELMYQPQDPVISGPSGVFVELPFIGYYQNDVEASALRFVLWNTETRADIE